jgi:hypothetical protein
MPELISDQDEDDIMHLAATNGGYWGEHPEHPVEDWLYEIANLDTRRGYWEWVEARIANDAS